MTTRHSGLGVRALSRRPWLRLACFATIAAIAVGCSSTVSPSLVDNTLSVTPPPKTPAVISPSSSPAPSVLHGKFTMTGSMTEARSEYAAVLLLNGKVLVCGGAGGYAAALQTAELYDPTKGIFLATGPMEVARKNETATLLTDGRVLLAGGDPDGSSSAELYDPTTGTFAATGSMAHPRSFATATLLRDGTVLVLGGATDTATLSSAEIFDPSSGHFRSLGWLGPPREGQTATLLRDGRVLIAGGGNDVDVPQTFDTVVYSSAEIYDPTTRKLSSTDSMTAPRSGAAAAILPDGRVFIAGGEGADQLPAATADIYDPQTGTFTSTTPLPTAQERIPAARLPDGRVLLAQGEQPVIFDGSTEKYAPTDSLPALTNGGYETAVALKSGIVLMLAGDVPNAALYWP